MHTLELLIVGIEDVPESAGSDWMAPAGMPWQYVVRDKMPWYVVPCGRYTYSWEPVGIQLLFDETMTADEMKQVSAAIVARLCSNGHDARLMVIDTGGGLPIRF